MTYAEEFFRALMENRVSIKVSGSILSDKNGPSQEHHDDRRTLSIVVTPSEQEEMLGLEKQFGEHEQFYSELFNDIHKLSDYAFYAKHGGSKEDASYAHSDGLYWCNKKNNKGQS